MKAGTSRLEDHQGGKGVYKILRSVAKDRRGELDHAPTVHTKIGEY
jgi:hypothetical protein